jgi:hypothetical protein
MKKIFSLSFLFVFLTSTAFAGTVDLPRTGQTKCYDTSGTEIPCAGTGQDGEIQAGVAWPEPRFTVNADTTIVDNLTGLVWAPDGNIMPNRDPGWDKDFFFTDTANDGKVTWQHALDYVAKLNSENYLGHADWRLPNVNELESLINAGEVNPATWLNTQGFTNVQTHYYYWSSTTDASGLDSAWCVDMWDGHVSQNWKYWHLDILRTAYVWPVRGGQCELFNHSVICLPKTGQTKCYNQLGAHIFCAGTGQDGEIQAGVAWPEPRFTDHGDGTVTDNLTGLMWTKDPILPYGQNEIMWFTALQYIAGMNAGTNPNFGYTDWCLPNRKELHSLIDYSQHDLALPSDYFSTFAYGIRVWSSTTSALRPDGAWIVDMRDGSVLWQQKYFYRNTTGAYVWPVRAGQVQPSTCSTWTDVKAKYQAYKNGQATLRDVIECFQEWRENQMD